MRHPPIDASHILRDHAGMQPSERQRPAMLTCQLCEPGHRVHAPKPYAATVVFHALVHHGVTIAELHLAVRYVAPHGDDWPENVRWRLRGPREWLYEWPKTGMRL